jgi:guanylate kinase
MEELERRLRGRGTEPGAVVQRRLECARRELACAHAYMHRIVNDDVRRAAEEICRILVAHSHQRPVESSGAAPQ